MAQSKLTSYFTSKKKTLILKGDGATNKIFKTPKRNRDDEEEIVPFQTPPIIKKRQFLSNDDSSLEITPSSSKKRKISDDHINIDCSLILPDSAAKRKLKLPDRDSSQNAGKNVIAKNSLVGICFCNSSKHNNTEMSVEKTNDIYSIRTADMRITKGELKNPKQRLQRLKELQEQLKNISNKKLKYHNQETPKTNENDGSDNPISTSKKESLPAYQRFHNLAVTEVPSLTLPYNYKILEEMFRSTDTIVSMLHNRHENCTFSKLKAGVQEMTRKNFELQHLAQIKTVFEEAFFFQQEKKLSNLAVNYSTSNYHLTIVPNINYSSKVTFLKNELSSSGQHDAESPIMKNKTVLKSMSPSVLLERRQIFHYKLVEIVKDHHQKFLSQLHPPIMINRENLKRWHPKFNVDEIPAIEPSALPSAPDDKSCASAKDVLDKVQGVYNKRIEEALQTVSRKYETLVITDSNPPLQNPEKSRPEIKGIPSDLLAKIRAKEAANVERELTRNPAEVRQLLMISRLPEITRILRNYFITEKKAAITLNDAIVKISESFTSSISLVDVEEHLRVLSNLVPKWLTFINLKKGLYLKINKEMNINEVIEKLSACEKNIKNCK